MKEGTFPAGSYVSSAISPYGRLAKTLLEKQTYPDAVTRTYDDASWTMGMMSHAEVKEIGDKAVLDVAVTPVTSDVKLAGTVSGPARCSRLRITDRTTWSRCATA